MVLTSTPPDTRPARPAARDFHRLAFRALGTDCQVDFEAASHAAAGDFKALVQGWVADFEARFSRCSSLQACPYNDCM